MVRDLASLRVGEEARVPVVVEELAKHRTVSGEPFFIVEVADASGRATMRIGPATELIAACPALASGDVIRLRAVVERTSPAIELQGLDLTRCEAPDRHDLAAVFGPLRPEAEALGRGIIAFDIETAPRFELGDLPSRERHKLARRAADDARRETGGVPDDDAVSRAARKALALNPLTARVVSIAFHALGDQLELAIVAGDAERLEPPAMALPEKDLLATFWGIARRARRLVGFNSRHFDVPVLLTRSALLDVEATTDLLGRRPDRDSRHIDLHETLSGDGARRFSLELGAFAFGIEAKIQGHGSEVERLLAAGRLQELAAYNIEDARATARLYERLLGTWL